MAAGPALTTPRWGWWTSRYVRTWNLVGMPGNSLAEDEQWAAGVTGPAYAIDDATAISVVDGSVDVISAGPWRLFGS